MTSQRLVYDGIEWNNYSRSFRKLPPRALRKEVAIRAGRLREWALVSDHVIKQQQVVAYESF